MSISDATITYTAPKYLRESTDFSRRYELLECLGNGSVGAVHRAVLRGAFGFNKPVAIKIIKRDGLENLDQVVQEAQVGALLRHPNVVEVFDLAMEADQIMIVMDFVDGQSLRSLLQLQDGLLPQVTLDIALQVCSGLTYIHQLHENDKWLSLVHCDIKPGNILVSRNGIVKIADFGIAQSVSMNAVSSDYILGTPAYMSPEQLVGDPLDARSDIFSMGLLLYECFTNQRLFRSTQVNDIFKELMNIESRLNEVKQEPLLLAVHPKLPAIIAKCLRKSSLNRYQTIVHLRQDLATLHPLKGPSLNGFLNENVFPVNHPPLDTLEVTKTINGNLPQRNNFVLKREYVNAKIEDAYNQERKWVVLKGPPGVGKTTLALDATRKISHLFPDGVWFIDFSDVDTQQDFLVQLSMTLGIEVQAIEEGKILSQLKVALDLMGNSLLILDNVEHLLPVVTTVLEEFRRVDSAVRFLLTSQVTPSRLGVTVIEVPPLTIAESIVFLKECAQAKGIDWTPENENQVMLNTLAHELDGIPLALDLAVSKLRLLSLEKLVKKLRNKFQILQSSSTVNPSRKVSLQDAIQWSWDLLNPWEQDILRQISVFHGGFAVDDAEVVIDLSSGPKGAWVVSQLEILVDRSMLQVRRVNRQPQFFLLRNIRDFLRKQNNDDRVREAKVRHLYHFAQWAHRIPEFNLHKGFWLVQNCREAMGNLYAAWRFAQQQQYPEKAAECGYVLGWIYNLIGPFQKGVQIVKASLIDKSISPSIRMHLLLIIAELYRKNDQPDRGFHAVNLVLKMATGQENKNIYIQGLLIKSILTNHYKDLSAGIALLHAAKTLSENMKNDPLLGRTLSLMGRYTSLAGAHHEATIHLEAGIRLLRNCGDEFGLMNALTFHSGVLRHLGSGDSIERVRITLLEALELARKLQEHRTVGLIANNLGLYHFLNGNTKKSLKYYLRALKEFRRMGEKPNGVLCLANIASCYLVLEKIDLAGKYLEMVRPLLATTTNLIVNLGFEINMVSLCLQRKDPFSALPYAKKAWGIIQEHGRQDFIAITAGLYAECLLLIDPRKNVEMIIDLIKQIESQIKSDSPALQIVKIHVRLGIAYWLFGNQGKAREHQREATKLIEKYNFADPVVHFAYRRLCRYIN